MKILTTFFAFCMVVTASFVVSSSESTPTTTCKDVKCFADKLQLEPSNLENWLNIASHMSVGETVAVGETEYPKPALVVAKAMEVTAQTSNASLWTQMAFYHRDYIHNAEAAKEKEPTIEVEGKEYTRLQMLQKALEIDPKFSRAWVVLSSHLRSLEDPLTQELWTTGTAKLPEMKQTAIINGKEYNARSAIDEALRVNIDDAGAWVELGRFINDKAGEKAVVDGKEYTRRQCFESAVQRGPRDFLAWILMGLELLTAPISYPNKPELTIFTNPAEDDKVYTAQHALIKAIELEPKFSLAWARLGDSLVAGTPQEVTILDKKFTKQQLYEQALRRDQNLATAWVSLAGTLSAVPNAKGQVPKSNPIHGIKYSAVGCLQRGLSLNPRLGIAWTLLGQRLGRDEKATLGEMQFTRFECFKNAVETDPRLPAAWGGLGTTMPTSGAKSVKIQYADDETKTDREVTSLDCFVKAISLKPDFASMYMSLSANVRGTERVLIPGISSPQDGDESSGFVDPLAEASNGVGKEGWTALQLLVRAAQLSDPSQGEVAGFLAQRMFERKLKEITFASPLSAGKVKTWTPKELLVEALKTRPNFGNFWYALGGQLAGPDNTAEINGKQYTMFDCLVQSLTYTPRNAMAWVNLGMLMGQLKIPEVKIKDETFGQKDALARSLEINPDEDRVWEMITSLMETDDEEIVIRGRRFLKKDIVAELGNMKKKRESKQ